MEGISNVPLCSATGTKKGTVYFIVQMFTFEFAPELYFTSVIFGFQVKNLEICKVQNKNKPNDKSYV